MDYLLKVFVFVCFTTLSVPRTSVLAANLGGCQLFLENGNPLDDNSWTFDHMVPRQVKDTSSSGDIVYTYACQDVISMTKGESTQPRPGVDYVTYQLNAEKTQLTVVVAAAFQDYEKNEAIAGLTLNTPVTFQCKNGASDLKFRVNVELSNNNLPFFADGTEDLMTLSMPYPNGLKVTTITVTDIDLGNQGITMTMDAVGEEYFQIMAPRVNGKVYEFDLKTKKQLNLESLMQVVVTATDNSQGVQNEAAATLKFEPDEVLSTPPSPRFTDALSIGDVSDRTLVGSAIPLTPPITFSEGYDAAEVSVTISNAVNADSSLFEVRMVGGTATIVLTSALPDEVLKEAFVILVLQAERPSAANTGRTVVHLSLPVQEATTTTQSSTTTGVTDCPVDCTECPTDGTTPCQGTSATTTMTTQGTTTPAIDEGTIRFEKDDYEGEIGAGVTGNVVRVTATADPVRPVVYEVETTSSVIKKRVTVDTHGNVDADMLPPGTYIFTVGATVQDTSLYAYTKVTIRVQSTSFCGDVPQFEYALSVISITENTEQIVIPGVTAVVGTDCFYSLDSSDYFSIDSATGELTSRKVDRESEMFADMETPQVSVHLNVKCAEDSRHVENLPDGHRFTRDTKLDYSEIESVENSKQSMAVVAIIEDVNDNPPVFATPNPIVVGYPSESLMSQLNPTSLITVRATDLDVGINAEIEYSLSPGTTEGRFYVHPKSGTLYLLASEFTYIDQEVNILATDMAGEGMPCKQPLNIKVKIVSRSQLTEVLIEGALLEQVDDVLQEMSLKTGLLVRSFSSSVVPSFAASSATTTTAAPSARKSRMKRDLAAADEISQSLLRMIVYAVNQQDQVVPSEEFKTEMQAFDSWVVQDIRQLEPNTEPSDNTGLVAAVISLGVIVAVMLIAAGVVFFIFYVRPRMKRATHLQDLINNGYEDSNSDVSSSAESKDVEADGTANITSWLHMAGDSKTPATTGNSNSGNFVESHPPQATSVNMEGSSHILSQFIMPENLEAYNNPIGGNVRAYPGDSDSEDDVKTSDEFGTRKNGERKKSVVTFNESVDCIEIEKL